MSEKKIVRKNVTVSCSLRKDLMDYVDRRASEIGISRSGFISMCVSEKMKNEDMLPRVNAVMDSFSNLVNNFCDGKISNDQAQMQIDDLNFQINQMKK